MLLSGYENSFSTTVICIQEISNKIALPGKCDWKLYNFEIMLTSLSGLLNVINMFPSEETCFVLLVGVVKMENSVYALDKVLWT